MVTCGSPASSHANSGHCLRREGPKASLFRTFERNGQHAWLTILPEHYLSPLHLALETSIPSLPFNVSTTAFPSGTGQMISALRSHEIDIAIGLTEGWVAGLVGTDQLQKGQEDGGYKVIGQWVESPLRWAIVTGRDRDDVDSVSDLKSTRVGVSRMGRYVIVISCLLDRPNPPRVIVTCGPAAGLTSCHPSSPRTRNGLSRSTSSL